MSHLLVGTIQNMADESSLCLKENTIFIYEFCMVLTQLKNKTEPTNLIQDQCLPLQRKENETVSK